MSYNGLEDNSLIVPGKRNSDSPLNTAAGIANDVQNNGYTLTMMYGDLAYADGYLGKASATSLANDAMKCLCIRLTATFDTPYASSSIQK